MHSTDSIERLQYLARGGFSRRCRKCFRRGRRGSLPLCSELRGNAVERDKFAIYDCLVRKLRKRLCENWKSRCEIILVSRHQPHAAAALDSKRSVTIQFDFVFPIRTFRQLRNSKALHGFDESSRVFWTALLLRLIRALSQRAYCSWPRRIAAIVVAFMIP